MANYGIFETDNFQDNISNIHLGGSKNMQKKLEAMFTPSREMNLISAGTSKSFEISLRRPGDIASAIGASFMKSMRKSISYT